MKGKRLAIVTCILDDWGGSEELWARSLDHIDESILESITVYKRKINLAHPEFKSLKKKNIALIELEPNLKITKKIKVKLKDIVRRIADKLELLEYEWDKSVEAFYKHLSSKQHDLVLISQGINFDGLAFAKQCLKLNIPYIIVAHKAVDFYWPPPTLRSSMKEILMRAEKCFFVSEHNRKLTEEQFGIRIINSEVVFNPVKTHVNPLPYPSTEQDFRLACVGRLFIIDKGQDILLRVLSKPKWQLRNLTVSFIGDGPDKEGLTELAKLLGVQKVSFSGVVNDLTEIWANHHALILPSRSEGMPLTLIEAMSLGRLAIATNAGGNAEVIEHGVTGYIAEPNEKDLDDVMELAWQNRQNWELIGIKAAAHIQACVPQYPENIFAKFLNDTLNEQ